MYYNTYGLQYLQSFICRWSLTQNSCFGDIFALAPTCMLIQNWQHFDTLRTCRQHVADIPSYDEDEGWSYCWTAADHLSRQVPKKNYVSCYPVTGSWMHIREQEASGVCCLCANPEHTFVSSPRLKSGDLQIEAECMGEWYWSTVNKRNLPRLYKIRKEPILDPGATRHHQAGTGIWHCDTPRKAQKQHYKKVAKYESNVNWQGSRRNDMEAVNQAFGTNEMEIKQKSLEAIRLLRQADCALGKICKYIIDCTTYVWTWWSTNTRSSARVILEMCSGELTRKQDSCLSQLVCHTSE